MLVVLAVLAVLAVRRSWRSRRPWRFRRSRRVRRQAGVRPLLDSDPRQIGPYGIAGRLGQGAMGHVYLGFSQDGTAFALKVLRPDFASDADFRRRFAREIAAARAVRSPFVNAVTDADPEAATPWLASYYVPGPSLNSALGDAGPFAPRSVAHLGAAIGLALQAIHTAGVVHRDLKPANVLVAADGPRVIDFGIARAGDPSLLTSAGMRLGTPSFMAPEQVAGGRVEAPADVWAAGVTLAYAATGRTPFGDGAAMAVLYRVEHQEPDLSGLDPALATIAARCLAKDPAARPTAAHLVELCRAALYGGSAEVPALAGSDEAGWLSAPVARDLAGRAAELAAVREGWVGGGGRAGGGPVGGSAGADGGGAASGGGRGLFGRRKGGSKAVPEVGGVSGVGGVGAAGVSAGAPPAAVPGWGPDAGPALAAPGLAAPVPPAVGGPGGAVSPGFPSSADAPSEPAAFSSPNAPSELASTGPSTPGAPIGGVRPQTSELPSAGAAPVPNVRPAGVGPEVPPAAPVAPAAPVGQSGGVSLPQGQAWGPPPAPHAPVPPSAPALNSPEPAFPPAPASPPEPASPPAPAPSHAPVPSVTRSDAPVRDAEPALPHVTGAVFTPMAEGAGKVVSVPEPPNLDHTVVVRTDRLDKTDGALGDVLEAFGMFDGVPDRLAETDGALGDVLEAFGDGEPTVPVDSLPSRDPGDEPTVPTPVAFAAPAPPVGAAAPASLDATVETAVYVPPSAPTIPPQDSTIEHPAMPRQVPPPAPTQYSQPPAPAQYASGQPAPAFQPGPPAPEPYYVPPAAPPQFTPPPAPPQAAPPQFGAPHPAYPAASQPPPPPVAPRPVHPGSTAQLGTTAQFGQPGQPEQPGQFGQPAHPAHPAHPGYPGQPGHPGYPAQSGINAAPAPAPGHTTPIPPSPPMSNPYNSPQSPPAPPPAAQPPPQRVPKPQRKRLIRILAVIALLAIAGAAAAYAITQRFHKSTDSGGTTGAADTSSPAHGTPGAAAGPAGAQDVVLRGLYQAAADRDWSLVCSSQTAGAQGEAARSEGWDGKGSPAALCRKYFQANWGQVDAGYLRGVKVLTAQQVDADHMTITVDDRVGDSTTRPFAVEWSGSRWLLAQQH